MDQLEHAAKILARGGLAIGPTETFFGLFALATDHAAVARAAQAKGRPQGKPLPVVIGHPDQLEQVCSGGGEGVKKLMDAFWPGPLTLLLPAHPALSPLCVRDGLVAVRHTPHPAAGKLSRLAGGPLTASSANISGQPPVVNAADVDPALRARVDCLVNSGPPPSGGLPSTLVQVLPGGDLCLVRRGSVAEERLAALGFAVAGKKA